MGTPVSEETFISGYSTFFEGPLSCRYRQAGIRGKSLEFEIL